MKIPHSVLGHTQASDNLGAIWYLYMWYLIYSIPAQQRGFLFVGVWVCIEINEHIIYMNKSSELELEEILKELEGVYLHGSHL